MRYYEREHVDAYARIRALGLSQWSDLHEELAGFHDFPNRTFLDAVLPPITDGRSVRVLEYGCGTGPAACFLAGRGYTVQGIDLVPDAIHLARRHAADLGLDIRFEVEDVCRWGDAPAEYDVIVDSFCLQSIVLDADRARVLEGVRRRLKPDGRYVLSTAVFDPAREYGSDRFDPDTGIVRIPATGPDDDAIRVDGRWYRPHRRHLTAEALRAELLAAGLSVLRRSSGGGDVVCAVVGHHDS